MTRSAFFCANQEPILDKTLTKLSNKYVFENFSKLEAY